MRILLLLLFTCFCGHAVHAQKCKYDFDKTDPMTDERVRRNVYEVKDYFRIGLYRKGSDMRVELHVRMLQLRDEVILKGAPLDLRLTDGSMITVYAAQDAGPIAAAALGHLYTSWAISYHISADDMRRISNSGIKVARATVSGEELVYELKEKLSKKTAEGAQCLLQN